MIPSFGHWLSILHLPLYKHEEVDSILFLVDDQIEIAEKGKQPEIREIPANTIVINTSNIKKEYSAFFMVCSDRSNE